jgi:hypothetical protein
MYTEGTGKEGWLHDVYASPYNLLSPSMVTVSLDPVSHQCSGSDRQEFLVFISIKY